MADAIQIEGFDGCPLVTEQLCKFDGLGHIDDAVVVPVDDEGRWRVPRDVAYWRGYAEDIVTGIGSKRASASPKEVEHMRLVAQMVGLEVGGSVKINDPPDGVRNAWVHDLGFERVDPGGEAYHESEVSTRRRPGDRDPTRIDVEAVGELPHEPDGDLAIAEILRPRTRAKVVVHAHRNKTIRGECAAGIDIDRPPATARFPASAVDPNDGRQGRAVDGLPRKVYVQLVGRPWAEKLDILNLSDAVLAQGREEDASQ